MAVPDERSAALEIGDAAEQTRLAIVEVILSRPHEVDEPSLTEIDDFSMDANADSISVAITDGKSTTFLKIQDTDSSIGITRLYQLGGDGAITVSDIATKRLNATSLPRPSEISRVHGLSDTIAALISRSEQVSEMPEVSEETQRDQLQNVMLAGRLPFSSSPPVSLRLHAFEGVTCGAAWSEQELMVSVPNLIPRHRLIKPQAFDLVSNIVRPRASIQLSSRLQKVSWTSPELLQLIYDVSFYTSFPYLSNAIIVGQARYLRSSSSEVADWDSY